MQFEWDEAKNEANFAKHGVWFDLVAERFDEEPHYEGRSDFDAEPRWLRAIKIRDKFFLVVYTRRNGRVRVISARRVDDDERRKLGLV